MARARTNKNDTGANVGYEAQLWQMADVQLSLNNAEACPFNPELFPRLAIETAVP